MREVNIYIDRTWEGNFRNGQGEYSIVLAFVDAQGELHTKEEYGGYSETTKNRLDILVAIKALSRMKEKCKIVIHINSTYIESIIKENRIEKWEETGWKTTNGKEVKNRDIWKKFKEVYAGHEIRINNIEHNEYSSAQRIQMGLRKIPHTTDRRKEDA